jgi:hypothetical protein
MTEPFYDTPDTLPERLAEMARLADYHSGQSRRIAAALELSPHELNWSRLAEGLSVPVEEPEVFSAAHRLLHALQEYHRRELAALAGQLKSPEGVPSEEQPATA